MPHGAAGKISSNVKATTAHRTLARVAAWMMMPDLFLPRGMARFKCGQLYVSRSGQLLVSAEGAGKYDLIRPAPASSLSFAAAGTCRWAGAEYATTQFVSTNT